MGPVLVSRWVPTRCGLWARRASERISRKRGNLREEMKRRRTQVENVAIAIDLVARAAKDEQLAATNTGGVAPAS